MQRQLPEGLSRELLVIKTDLLEAHIRKLEAIFTKGNGPLTIRDLDVLRCDVIHEKAKLTEKVQVLEGQNHQMQKDLETLIFRIEELELDNQRMEIKLNTSS